MGKPSIIFRIQRWVYFLLKGIGKREKEHFLFSVHRPWGDAEVYCTLANYGWQPNYLGFVYRGQVYQCRRLVNSGQHQYHLRFYDDGRVTGHFETSPEYDTSYHLAGVDLRTMTSEETNELIEQLGVAGRIWREKENLLHRAHFATPLKRFGLGETC